MNTLGLGRFLAACVAVAALALTGSPALAQVTTGPVITYAPVPDPHIPDYVVAGRFPVISGSGTVAEEAAVRHAFAVYSAGYRTSALRVAPGPDPAAQGYFGVNGAVAVANRTYVSTLEDMDTVYPGGNDGQNVFSVTALASGATIGIRSMFTAAEGLRPVATLAKAQVLARYACVRDAEDDPTLGSVYDHAWDPVTATFAHFAVTLRGLLVSFNQGMFSYEACGQQHALISWGALRSALSPLGKRLAAAASPSRNYGRIF